MLWANSDMKDAQSCLRHMNIKKHECILQLFFKCREKMCGPNFRWSVAEKEVRDKWYPRKHTTEFCGKPQKWKKGHKQPDYFISHFHDLICISVIATNLINISIIDTAVTHPAFHGKARDNCFINSNYANLCLFPMLLDSSQERNALFPLLWYKMNTKNHPDIILEAYIQLYQVSN